MAWIELHQELREHKKLYACADMLGVSRVTMLGSLACLWLWALDNVPDGSLQGISNRTIARVCDWKEKKADALVEALISTGWLDRHGDTLVIHDWMEYAGKLMERRSKDRERKKNSKTVPQKSEGIPAEQQRSSIVNPVLQYPNSTTTVPAPNISAHNAVADTVPAPEDALAPHSGKPFTAFWDAYPSKIGREDAWEAWKTLNPSPETAQQILAALDAWKKSGQWTEDGGRFIPGAAKFLSKEYWKSPPPPAKDKGSGTVRASDWSTPDEDTRRAVQRMLAAPLIDEEVPV